MLTLYFESLMHLNYICFLLHQYSSFLPGELLFADKITCSHFSTVPEGADLCFTAWRKGKHYRNGDNFVGVLIRS